MKLLLKAGVLPVAAVATMAGAGSSNAFAQDLTNNVPMVRAVATTVTDTVSTVTSVVQATDVTSPPTLSQLVDTQMDGAPLDAQGKCLATAVYFEAMGETLEGQLAVANVVINRARSGQYPSSWCGVVKQRAQFSFVRNGRFPRIDINCVEWERAQAIARIAALNLKTALPDDVLWYHADYVAPRWRTNLTKVEKIGAHIFYRS
nr:cell wall hydrolase [uncultured Sphingomonas sp.]